MSKKKWCTERRWEYTREEKKFEDMLTTNGFAIVGIREYLSRTDYLIEKDGIQQEYALWRGESSAKDNYACFIMFYNTKVEYEQLKAKQGC